MSCKAFVRSQFFVILLAVPVIMMQVENEVGVIPEARDHSAVADQAFAAHVPADLQLFLKQHTLSPEFRVIWDAAGGKELGTWDEMFGKNQVTEDLFMAWHFARYVNSVVVAGKAEYALPMFTNAALIRPNYQPGQYNSGGPLPHSLDIWRVGAPALDFFSPDIYFENFAEWSRKYHGSGNPVFVPEAIGDATGAANALYAIGELQAIGFSPFGIDGAQGARSGDEPSDGTLTTIYATLAHLAPQILQAQAEGKIRTLLMEGESQRTGRMSLGDFTFTAVRSNPTEAGKRGAAMFLQLSPDEYIVTGVGNLTITFSPNTPGPPIAGIVSIDEETLEGEHWTRGRRLNGDENGQGQVLRLQASLRPVILRIRLYRYR
ncbi:MAG TPA: DUF5597 domain-containing protein [Candidatus Angelobacter sp.]|nr:DUF5597 domain-containing protein [Candidatus Angelobacter sp.]